jgi:hypothetical protein
MAGLVDTTTINPGTTIAEANAQVDSLDAARQAARGVQNTGLRDLFSYDQSLSDRYSSPDSKMFLENPAAREKAISGYSDIGRTQVNNLFDIMESVRSAEERMKTVIADLKASKAGGSGTSSLSLDDFLNFAKSGQDNVIPDPPQKLLDAAAADPTKQINYMKNDDGTFAYEVVPKGKFSRPEMKEWTKQPVIDKNQILMDTFGVDKATLAQLAAVQAINPKLADKLFASVISNSVTSVAKDNSVTTDDMVAQVKEYPTRADALADLNRNRSAMTSRGIDVARVEREIDTYFTKKEQTDAANQPFDLNALKAAKGGQ